MRKRARTTVTDDIPQHAEENSDYAKARKYEQSQEKNRLTKEKEVVSAINGFKQFVEKNPTFFKAGLMETLQEDTIEYLKGDMTNDSIPASIEVTAGFQRGYQELSLKHEAYVAKTEAAAAIKVTPSLAKKENRVAASSSDPFEALEARVRSSFNAETVTTPVTQNFEPTPEQMAKYASM